MAYHQYVFLFNLNVHLIVIEYRKNFHFKRLDMLSLSINFQIHNQIYIFVRILFKKLLIS